jgi:hypothetical protein
MMVQCYEVRCHPKILRDGYGNTLDRQSMCRDTSATVVVRTVDACELLGAGCMGHYHQA